jgi:hypothetical protein
MSTIILDIEGKNLYEWEERILTLAASQQAKTTDVSEILIENYKKNCPQIHRNEMILIFLNRLW